MNKLVAGVLVASFLSASSPATAQWNSGNNYDTNDLNNVETALANQGLYNKVPCTVNNKVMVNVQDRGGAGRATLCFAPTSVFTPGTYTFNTQTGQFNKQCVVIGSRNSCDNEHQGGGNWQQPGQPSQPYPYGSQSYPAPAPAPTLGPIMSLNGAPVPPHIEASLKGIAASHNLALTACETNTVHVVVNNAYKFCAYPTGEYSVGSYNITVRGLH